MGKEVKSVLIGEKVILWGCGDGGKFAYEHLKDKVDIEAFGDRSAAKIGTEYMGMHVLSAQQVINEYPDAIILNTIMSAPHDSIKQELRELGIRNKECCLPIYRLFRKK